MGKTVNPKERAKIVHKRLKACGYLTDIFRERFEPDKSNTVDYSKFIEDINLYNKYYGYIMRIEL